MKKKKRHCSSPPSKFTRQCPRNKVLYYLAPLESTDIGRFCCRKRPRLTPKRPKRSKRPQRTAMSNRLDQQYIWPQIQAETQPQVQIQIQPQFDYQQLSSVVPLDPTSAGSVGPAGSSLGSFISPVVQSKLPYAQYYISSLSPQLVQFSRPGQQVQLVQPVQVTQQQLPLPITIPNNDLTIPTFEGTIVPVLIVPATTAGQNGQIGKSGQAEQANILSFDEFNDSEINAIADVVDIDQYKNVPLKFYTNLELARLFLNPQVFESLILITQNPVGPLSSANFASSVSSAGPTSSSSKEFKLLTDIKYIRFGNNTFIVKSSNNSNKTFVLESRSTRRRIDMYQNQNLVIQTIKKELDDFDREAKRNQGRSNKAKIFLMSELVLPDLEELASKNINFNISKSSEFSQALFDSNSRKIDWFSKAWIKTSELVNEVIMFL